jgi:branched-chain amino acid transport system permease protein
LLAYVLNGLAAGGGYALAGVGLSYTIGISRVMNFAFGSFYMLGAFLVAYIMEKALGVGYVLACGAMLAAIVAIGYVFGRVAVLPIVRVSEDAVMVATLAISLIFTNVALLTFGSEARFIRSPFQEISFAVSGTYVTVQAIFALMAAPLVTGILVAFMRRTTMGTRIRATAQNPQLAAATGVKTSSVYLTAVVIGVALAGLAGALFAPTTVIDINVGNPLLLKAFTVAALAGMGHLWGATFVGIAMGVAESVFSGYVSPAYAETFIFGLLIVTLLFFPRGLFKGA